MARPSRTELMRRLFPELGRTCTGGETEAAIAINTRACEAILADQIKLFDSFMERYGLGALVIKLASKDRDSYYVTLDSFCEDLLAAEAASDIHNSGFLRDVISRIKVTDTTGNALFLLIDNSQASLLAVPREYPAKAIQQLQESHTL
jgi:hypothetical protein